MTDAAINVSINKFTTRTHLPRSGLSGRSRRQVRESAGIESRGTAKSSTLIPPINPLPESPTIRQFISIYLNAAVNSSAEEFKLMHFLQIELKIERCPDHKMKIHSNRQFRQKVSSTIVSRDHGQRANFYRPSRGSCRRHGSSFNSTTWSFFFSLPKNPICQTRKSALVWLFGSLLVRLSNWQSWLLQSAHSTLLLRGNYIQFSLSVDFIQNFHRIRLVAPIAQWHTFKYR